MSNIARCCIGAKKMEFSDSDITFHNPNSDFIFIDWFSTTDSGRFISIPSQPSNAHWNLYISRRHIAASTSACKTCN